MVMATPSPECVGREFVRQYYTLLNEAPLHLHRFYSNNSSFLHGGVDHEEPVIGQAAIHKKIMSLNFRDCHAKIRQVDSHATLGDGVVVQVTGELSNNGQPMRRFMQTFVLAPQSPKKYYVHNDIFRYQDEVFNDDEETDNLDASPVESEGEVEDERSESPPNAVDDMRDPAIASFYHSSSVTNGTVEEIPQPIQAVMKPEVEDIVENLENVTQAAPTSPMTPLSPEIQPSPPSPPQQQQQQQPVEEPQTTTPIQTMIENHTGSPTSTKDELQELETPKTLSWADRARQNSPMIVSAPNVVKQSPSQPGSPPSKEQNKITESGSGRAEPLPQRAPRQSGRGMGRGTPPNIGSDGAMSDQPIRSRPRHPDSHQVFVGNLPHDINEDELKNHFMAYGNVVEMRINTKSGGGKIPNFGFIVFDDPSPVQRILSEKPIMFRGEHRLNVEEKKARGPRTDIRGGKIDSRPMGGPGRGLGGPQGGGRGGGRGGGIGGAMNKGSGGGGGGGGGGNRFNPRR